MSRNVTIIPPSERKPDILRVAAYCRVSSDSSDQLHSYASQIRKYTEEISHHQGWELVDIYADEGFKEFLAENAGSKANSELLRWRVQIESELDIRPMAEYDGEPIYGLTFMSRGEERLREPIAALQDEFNFCIQDTDACGIVNGELINKAYHKGLAVERLCEYLNIPREDTVAFGDSMNDLELLQTAAVGVCMENGSPQLKAAADLICPPVTEDGLYRGFQMLGLLEREK